MLLIVYVHVSMRVCVFAYMCFLFCYMVCLYVFFVLLYGMPTCVFVLLCSMTQTHTHLVRVACIKGSPCFIVCIKRSHNHHTGV